jgi:branched-chain amino acid transport system substrate-binding protein
MRRWVTAASLLVLLLSACAGGSGGESGESGGGSTEAAAGGESTGGDSEPIRIGAVLGISGRFAFVGQGQQNALALAQDEINEAGGIAGRPVEFVVYDDEVDETKSVQLTNRLIGEDGVVAVIGPSITIPALAIAPIIEREQVPNITLTSAAIWEEQDARYIYQTTPREEIETLSILAFLAEELDARRVAVLYDDQPYGTRNLAFIEQFAPDYDIEIVGTESITNDATDAVAQLERLRATDADALIVWVGDPAASSAAKGLDQIGWDVPTIGSSAIAGPRFVELGGAAAEGIYSDATLNYAEPPPNQAAFLEAYLERFDAPPTQFAAFAYDAAYALKAAIEHAEGSTEADDIVQGLVDMPPLEGVNATFDFTEDNHNGIPLAPQFLIVQVTDGQFQVVADTSELPAP